MPSGPDPKWRFFWRVGERPLAENTRFPELNAAPVIPKARLLENAPVPPLFSPRCRLSPLPSQTSPLSLPSPCATTSDGAAPSLPEKEPTCIFPVTDVYLSGPLIWFPFGRRSRGGAR